MYFLGMFSFLAVLFPLWLLSGIEGGHWIFSTTLALTVLLFSALRLSFLAQSQRPELFCMTFYVFIYVWCGIAAITQTWLWRYSWHIKHTPWDAEDALVMVLVAMVAYEFGRLLARGRHNANPQARLSSPAIKPTWLISDQVLVGLCIFAWISVIFCTIWIGGLDVLFLSRGQSSDYASTWSGGTMEYILIWAFLHAPPFVGLYLTIYLCLKRWTALNRSQRQLYGFLLVGMLVLNYAANYPPGQLRLWLGTILIAPAFAVTRWKSRAVAMWILALVVVCVIVFPNSDIFKRSQSVDASLDSLSLTEQPIQQFINKGDFDVLQQTANGVVYVQRFDYMYGRNLVGAVLFWVPRSLWADKPRGTGVTVPCALGYQFCNLSAPLWMEFYVAFGLIGVFILTAFYGFFSAKADQKYCEQQKASSSVNVFDFLIPFLAAFQFFILRGDLMNALAFPALTILLIWIATRRPRVVRRMR